MTQAASGGGDRIVVGNISLSLDGLSITLCPELPGGGDRLFGDGPGGSSWSLTQTASTGSGALCLLAGWPRRTPTGRRSSRTCGGCG